MRERQLATFAREMEARDPEEYARLLRSVEKRAPVDGLDARTIAAIILAMKMDGRIDPDALATCSDPASRLP